jgi:hypothetical protein
MFARNLLTAFTTSSMAIESYGYPPSFPEVTAVAIK